MSISPKRVKRKLARVALVVALIGLGNIVYTAFPCLGPVTAYADTNSSSELVVDNNYPSLDGWIANKLGTASIIKITTSSCGVSDSGTKATTIPAQVKKLTGWQQYFWESEGKPYNRQLGYAGGNEMLTFEVGSSTEVNSLSLKLQNDKLVVPAGANITFKNCTFTSRIKIDKGGRATFENCAFATGTILNNGQANYSGSTQEPKNEGKAESAFEDLKLTSSETSFDNAMKGYAYKQDVPLMISGTNSDTAEITAQLDQVESGLFASINENTLTISGTPKIAGLVKVTVIATASDEAGTGTQTSSVDVILNVSQRYTFSLEGTLDAVRSGQGDYADSANSKLKVVVTSEDGIQQGFYDFSTSDSGKDVDLKPFISPDGSGLSAYIFNSAAGSELSLSGTAGEAGTYDVGAIVNFKGQTLKTNTVQLRIYSANETLKSQLSTLNGNISEWDMEPYEIDRSDNAVIPKTLRHIFGSHQSGLYGQIGNATEEFASDTLTVPAGTDVTLENIKVNSSVKIIVEKGGKLTLTDSAVYGPVEVNGGTLTINNSASNMSTITLNNGSTLKDSEIVSHAQFLTDGRKPTRPAPAHVVSVNGKVTFEGNNSIKADQSQIGLEVKGIAHILEGSKLSITGGNGGTAPGNAESAINLINGTIDGKGTLQAIGGTYEVGGSGTPAKAVKGKGKLSTAKLILAGGDANSIFNTKINGANAGTKDITVTTPANSRTIKGGKGVNGGADGLGEESLTIADNDLVQKPSVESDATQGNTTSSMASTKESTTTKATPIIPQTGDGTVQLVAAATIIGFVSLLAVVAFALRKHLKI